MWFKSLDGKAAVTWRKENLNETPRLVLARDQFVVIRIGSICLVSCYVSPDEDRGRFGPFLNELTGVIGSLGDLFLICGDFNAKSPHWGLPRANNRGRMLEEWASELDLRIMNDGMELTCVRLQGTSFIDLTWVSPGLANRVQGWVVLRDVETFSNHQYIRFDLNRGVVRNRSQEKYLRWRWDKLDKDLFHALMIWHGKSGK